MKTFKHSTSLSPRQSSKQQHLISTFFLSSCLVFMIMMNLIYFDIESCHEGDGWEKAASVRARHTRRLKCTDQEERYLHWNVDEFWKKKSWLIKSLSTSAWDVKFFLRYLDLWLAVIGWDLRLLCDNLPSSCGSWQTWGICSNKCYKTQHRVEKDSSSQQQCDLIRFLIVIVFVKSLNSPHTEGRLVREKCE